MAILDRMSGDTLEKLKQLKLDNPNQTQDEKQVMNEEEEQALREEILRQIDEEQENDEINLDLFSTSVSLDGSESIVEVDYYGRIGYVDISFESLDEDITELEYQEIIQAIETVSYKNDENVWRQSIKTIERFGDRAIVILFRECRKFDLSDEKRISMIIQLLNRLTNRSLKGRRTIKAILENANIQQHVKFALLAAGSIRDKEAVDGIIHRLEDPEYFKYALDALFKLAPKDKIEKIMKTISEIDLRRTDLIEYAIIQAHQFVQFGPQSVRTIFDLYLKNDKKQLQPIYSRALQAFKEDAIPMLREVLYETKDDKILVSICKTLGSLRMTHSTNILLDALEKFPENQRAVIKGLGFTRDQAVSPYIIEVLKESNSIHIKQECLLTLAFVGHRSEQVKAQVRHYLKDRSSSLYLDALNCLVILGDIDSMHEYINLLVKGTESEQYAIQKHMGKLQAFQQIKLGEALLRHTDEESVLIVMGLQKSNVLDQRLGLILEKRLETASLPSLRIEIYKLIGKHVNKKKELLPQKFLYDAKYKETNPRVVRELEQIISSMKKTSGHLSVLRG
ncbi:HEAT repeat domain-containing protein [Paenibacillus sp. FSL K6-2862]|uniref:HEAT repeat domain-containing protein n=1 Tax=Paenibacillus sp. FSL K6-2862 TaxID=2921484 RepID=UPI0030FA82CD